MIKNYFTVAIRSLLKNKFHSLINIFGLAIGFAASIIVFTYAESELTYNSGYENSDRIYQVYKERQIPTGTQIVRDTWYPMADALKRDYPTIENATHIWDDNGWIEAGEKKFNEEITIAQANVFDFFSFPLKVGNRETVFTDPFSAVVNQEIAAKYFGDENPIGKVFKLDFDKNYTITGVLGEIPSNSSFQPQIMIPSTRYSDELKEEWGNSWLFTYLLLKKGADPKALEAQLPSFVTKIWNAEDAERMKLKLTALPDLYNEVNDSDTYAYILLIVALSILFIASINFMNLSTAKSLDRALDIGMRKVLGASKLQLIKQYLSESLFVAFAALAIGLLLTVFALPEFNSLFDMKLKLPYFDNPASLLGLIATALVVGIAAGIYPALVLTKFKPVETLKGKFKNNSSGLAVRNGLVVIQFVLSIVLLIGTGVMRNQIGYMKNANLNFDKDNLMIIPIEVSDFADREAAAQKLQTFKNELKSYSGIKSIASSSHVPGRWAGWFTFVYPNDRPEDQRLRERMAVVDENFFPTYGIKIIDGENFSLEKMAESSDGVIINQAALKDLGWLSKDDGLLKLGGKERKIIAVVEDYHFESLETEVTPVIHRFLPAEHPVHNYVTVKLGGGDLTGTVDFIKSKWSTLDPSRSMEFFFADKNFNQLYETQERLETVALSFSILAIVIACLGLFALASLMVSQRQKEIGVRKVMGATEANIAGLFIKYFAKYVFIAFVLAAPLAYYLMDEWLQKFAYKSEIGLGVFIFGGAVVLLIAMATVGFQSVKAALTNPIDTLRNE